MSAWRRMFASGLRGMLVAGVWLSFFPAAVALAAPPSTSELRAWLAGLDADDYVQRENASRRLIEAGEAAIDLLAEGVGSPSAEAAWRASSALEQIALHGDESALARVSEALARLSQQGRPGLAHLAQELKAKQAQLKRERAAARIRGFGGRLSGSEYSEVFGGFFGGGMPAIVEVIDEVVAEKVAEDIKVLVEAGEPVADDGKPLEISPDLKAFGDGLKLAAAGMGKAAEPNEKDPPPPPDAPPPEPLAPPAPPAADEPPAIAVAAVDPFAEVFIADAVGIDLGFAVEGDVEAQESLAIGDDWRGGDAGLAALRDLPSVVSIQISGKQLTDAALPHIAALPKLASLELQGTAFSAAGLWKFRQQRPAARIYARGDAMLGVNADTEGPCVLTSIYYGSGAFDAGLVQGDEIVSVDGHKVADFSDLTIAVFTHRPGEKLQVEFKRGDELKKVSILLKDRKDVDRSRR